VAESDVHQKGELSAMLRGLGLSPTAFDALIDEAVRFDWTPEQFESRLYLSRPFQNAFPGIVREDGSLRISPVEYRQIRDAVFKIAGDYGVRMDNKRFGLLVENNKSPIEFASIAEVFRAAELTDGFRVAFNEQLKAAGQGQQLSSQDWFNMLAGEAPAEVNDLYEAARLTSAGLDITVEQARLAAKQIGPVGEAVDTAALISEVRRNKQFIGPELAAAGITDADLAVLASGADPRGVLPTVEQIFRNRQALAGPVARPVTAAGAAPGRVGLYPEIAEG
jgi:hypothetical protein